MANRNRSLLYAALAVCTVSFAYMSTAHAQDKTETTGDVLQVLTPLAAYGLTFLHDDEVGRRQFYNSFATTFAATHLLKNAIDAQRPNGGGQSFPSGHTSAAFQGAGFIHARYGLKAALPAYATATFVGYSRVVSDKHHLRDVIAGATLGVATSFFFTRERFTENGIDFVPFIDGENAGFSLSMSLP
jgi:membrane-associated phospholipid phosphatase